MKNVKRCLNACEIVCLSLMIVLEIVLLVKTVLNNKDVEETLLLEEME